MAHPTSRIKPITGAWTAEEQPSSTSVSCGDPGPSNWETDRWSAASQGCAPTHTVVPMDGELPAHGEDHCESPTTQSGKMPAKVLQFLSKVFLWFPSAEEHAFFRSQTRQRIKIMQVGAGWFTGWFLVRALVCALQGDPLGIVMQVSSGVQIGHLNASLTDTSSSTMAVQYSLSLALMLVGVWHSIVPFIPCTLEFLTCHPLLQFCTTLVYMAILAAIAVWEMSVRRDPLFDYLCVCISCSFMGFILYFRHWCVWALLGTLVLVYLDLSMKWYEIYGSPITAFVFMSIWHQEYQQRLLFRANEALAHEVAVRAKGEKVAVAAQKEALAAKDAADLARATESRFLARMSHEIRTPLSGMLGFLDLLAKTHLSQEQQELFEPMLTAARLLKLVVNDILDLSKSKAGMMQFTPQSRSLYQTIHSASTLFSALLASKELSYDMQIADSVSEFVALDHDRLQQMVANLLSNSIKFTNRGSIKCRVDPVSLGAGHEGIKVQVQDTGMGISAEAIPRLFQDFAQADESVARTHGGTGLGLSMVRRVSMAMGGSAGVTSVLGEGSCFWFTVAVFPEDGVSVAEMSHDTATFPTNFTIMIVDDTPMLLKMMQHQLAHWGCAGVFLKSGQEAVEHLRGVTEQRLPDLVLMDVWMPGMDGIAATAAIMEMWPQLVVVGLSGDSTEETREKALASGMAAVFAKPVQWPALVQWCGANPIAQRGLLELTDIRDVMDTGDLHRHP